MEKIKLALPVIVEGKYDKITLSSVVDANIITTDGFGVFKNDEKRALIKRLSRDGVIVLCDSDGAGGVIRSHISSFVPRDKLYQVYTPRLEGKERRKRAPSREGFLGVEGMSGETLREVILRLVERCPEVVGDVSRSREAITKVDFFELGLSGGTDSVERRRRVAERFALPPGMSANALLAALNYVVTREEFMLGVRDITDAE